MVLIIQILADTVNVCILMHLLWGEQSKIDMASAKGTKFVYCKHILKLKLKIVHIKMSSMCHHLSKCFKVKLTVFV